MKKLIYLSFLAILAATTSCDKCYTCTIPNTTNSEDYCGRGSDLNDLVDAAESVGYTCEKR